jgi:hypothetical protein
MSDLTFLPTVVWLSRSGRESSPLNIESPQNRFNIDILAVRIIQ